MIIKSALSNHHIHVTREVLDILFGKNYNLNVRRMLVQKGQFAAEETVTLIKNNKKIENVRIVGPCRKYTQVELLERDCEYLCINPPVRSSGNLEGSESITIVGPHGTYEAVESTIIADRHIHMSSEDLKEFNVSKGQIVKIKVNGLTLDEVMIKSDETCVLEYHMNKDEAENLGIENGMEVKIC